MNTRLLGSVLGVAVVAILSATLVRASDARILGTVVDSTGSPIDGVLVEVQGLRVAIDKQAFTDRKGRFSIFLSDGSLEYQINLTKEGFLSIQEPLAPRPGGVLRKTWSLESGTTEESNVEQELRKAQSLDEAATIYNEGADAYALGELELALKKFSEATHLDPELAPALIGSARIHVSQEEFEKALEKVTALLALEPSDLVGLRIRYDSLAALERWSEASAVLDQLVALDPSEGTARRVFNRGVQAVRVNDLKSAASRFETAVELDPSLAPALQALAQIYLSLQEPERAVGAAEEALALDGQSTEALSVLYQAHLMLGDEARSQAAFTRLQSIDPAAVAKAFFKEGTAQFNAGNVAQARETLEKVLDVDPNHARAHYSLGLCYLNLGDNDKARASFERFMELAPEDVDVAAAREMISYMD